MKLFSNSRHARLMLGAAVCALTLGSGAAFAQARPITIAPQTLASALHDFGSQTGHQIFFAPELAASKVSRGVAGATDEQLALAQILEGTGLTFRREANAFIIEEGASGPQSGSAAGDGAEVEALIVTAQKREEDIQDVPIAISAFTQEGLDEQKIEGGFDLLKAIPNVTFSKNNYSGYNFSIRGIGTKSISATSDPGVAVAFNNTSLIRNRLFEQEYLDIERIEVLRGPQGTLYGRNATSGVINVITAKPNFDDFEGRIKGEVGNYDARRLSAFVNVPVSDTLAIRLAGASTQRDGYGQNLKTGDSVDGRDLWTARLTVAFRPIERLRGEYIWEHFSEDDDRLRTGKQLCHRDDGPESVEGYNAPLTNIQRGRLSQGCKPGSLYDDAAFGSPNGLSMPFIMAGQLLIPLGAIEPLNGLFGPSVMAINPGLDPYGVEQSRDLRAMESMFNPEYRAEADIFALNLEFDLTDSLTLISQSLYNEDSVYSFQDYNRFATVPAFNDSSGGLYNPLVGADPTSPSPFSDMTPGGWFNDPQIGRANSIAGFEISSSESTQISQEFRLQSSFEGPVNFSVGANYTRFKALNDYYLFFNMVTMISYFYNRSTDPNVCNGGSLCMRVDPNPIGSLAGDGHNYFRNKNPYKLESQAAFGELYWEVTPSLKLTAGLRYTDDEKTFTPWRSQLLIQSYEYGPSPDIVQRWKEWTGRFGVDWKPVLPFTDDTMVYATYSRGYKGGGANPPPAQPASQNIVVTVHPETFDPEYVDAIEIGTKNTLLGGTLILNASAFHYDYRDYQVSKVVDRTIINETFDAKVWGVEFESVWRPMHGLRMNATLGYLDTRIGDGEKSIDIFNRTAGREGWMVVTPWIQATSNCILPTAYVAERLAQPTLPEPWAWVSGLTQACDVYLDTSGPSDLFDRDDPELNNGAGFATDVSGNELPNSPHWTFSVGAQYTMDLMDGWEATVRGDYYRQGESYARVYNLEADRLRAWDNANVSLRVERPDDALAFELYVKNVFDETPITDAFLNSDSTGMTTNIFVLDPRLIGLSVTKGF